MTPKPRELWDADDWRMEYEAACKQRDRYREALELIVNDDCGRKFAFAAHALSDEATK